MTSAIWRSLKRPNRSAAPAGKPAQGSGCISAGFVQFGAGFSSLASASDPSRLALSSRTLTPAPYAPSPHLQRSTPASVGRVLEESTALHTGYTMWRERQSVVAL